MSAHDRDPSGIPLTAWLAGIERLVRCGIHGTPISDRRCSDCDDERRA